MAFYTPSDNRFTRHYREEVEMGFSAIDCVLCGERAIYASTELTTGTRLYDALRQTGTKTAADLRKVLGGDWTRRVWDPNVSAALDFAKAVRRAQDDRTLVITPAPFTAPGWSQPEYLAFWETLLRTRIKAAWFNSNWQFSNGCTFEFAVALDTGIPTSDHEGQPLDVDTAAHLITDAINHLKSDGFDTSSLTENLHRVTSVRAPRRAVVEH